MPYKLIGTWMTVRSKAPCDDADGHSVTEDLVTHGSDFDRGFVHHSQ